MIDYKDVQEVSDLIAKYIKECERARIKFISAYEINDDYSGYIGDLITASDKLAVTTLKLQASIGLDEPTDAELIKNMSLPEVCKIEKTDLGFEVFLPPLNGKIFALGRKAADGKLARYILSSLMMKECDKLEKVDNPILIFEHHIDKNDKLLRSMDADNWTVKFVTDELQGFLIGDDNVLNLTTMHTGILDDESYCKINILPRNRLSEWVKNHPNFT